MWAVWWLIKASQKYFATTTNTFYAITWSSSGMALGDSKECYFQISQKLSQHKTMHILRGSALAGINVRAIQVTRHSTETPSTQQRDCITQRDEHRIVARIQILKVRKTERKQMEATQYWHRLCIHSSWWGKMWKNHQRIKGSTHCSENELPT